MRKRNLFLICFIFGLVLVPTILALWTAKAEREAHYVPEYEQVDLTFVLQKDSLEDSDYAMLLWQTGLSKSGVDDLYENGRQGQLLYLQQRFFTPIEYECRRSVFFCRSERIIGQEKEREENIGRSGIQMERREFCPAVQDGDILITFSGHLFGWRSGHAAIVTNAAMGQTLEAVTVGENSQISPLEHWREYPCFALLRLKNATEEERVEIASYAARNLVDIPYKLTGFCGKYGETQKQGDTDPDGKQRKEIADPGGKRQEDIAEPIEGTQCAHLVWLAYRHFGYDLNSDGGYIVTPYDIYSSEFLELVQIYGIPP